MPPTRLFRYLLLLIPLTLLLTLLTLRSGTLPNNIDDKLPHELTGEPAGYDPKAKPKPLYKPPPEKPPEIKDNFPLAASAKSPSDLPPIPSWNKPPHKPKRPTPLFIGFTRNWRLLQQTVVSYIVAGWPANEIYVVENTGVMQSNKDGALTLQNPFFLNHHRLEKILGVNVLITPTLMTFAQLQNFYMWTALQKGWEHYFWAHMDTVMVSDEEYDGEVYKSAYTRAVEALEETLEPGWGELATRWFAYDRLALVRTKGFLEVGGWDTMIPFYMTDCDMHERLWMRGLKIENAEAGKVWDVKDSLEDLGMLYQRGEVEAEGEGEKKEERRWLGEKRKGKAPEKNSPAYKELLKKLDDLQNAKAAGNRNTWQASQKGGQGEPFYRDSDGFEHALWMWMDFGRNIFAEKWGRGPCDIRDAGLKEGDEWRVLPKWEKEEVQRQYWKEREREAKEKERKDKEEKKER